MGVSAAKQAANTQRIGLLIKRNPTDRFGRASDWHRKYDPIIRPSATMSAVSNTAKTINEASMHLFISWSGPRSKALAEFLRDLLPNVLQNLKVWMSEHDIEAGARWSTTLSERLAGSDAGIACVTSENQHSPWLLFEAGALSKSLESGRLIPLLLDIGPSQITYPLAQFQLLQCDRPGLEKLIFSLNSMTTEPIEPQRLGRQIEKWWPDIQAAIASTNSIPVAVSSVPSRSTQDMLGEVLQEVRELAKTRASLPSGSDRIWVDTRPLIGSDGRMIAIQDLNDLTVSAFLDEIWTELSQMQDIPPYTYGTKWMLYKDTTALSDLGKSYIESRGRKKDNRNIRRFSIQAGDMLEVREARAQGSEHVQ
ncbi:toll/interleukin-1 receptor domain-containing protein [Variovorax robiniae]|uniref:Toll/interleukin-1 receptor domain-containing protein n=1 Tax=Variovorax robiniae TaxID=1836199 RepID=A0ABU8XJF9_9BURK